MSIYAVYTREGSFPEQIFNTKKAANDFVGNAISVYEVRHFHSLTKKQIVMLPLSKALDFEWDMTYAINKTQSQMEKKTK
jgi:hypothetical protein